GRRTRNDARRRAGVLRPRARCEQRASRRGPRTLRLWEERDAVLCEVSDSGVLDEPLAGRRRPAREEPTGRGLWLVNQLCDLVQIRSFREGCVVRVHMHRDPATANR
ncbi:MAG: ATP-binding protein, partial [Actinobacteria bacterium]